MAREEKLAELYVDIKARMDSLNKELDKLKTSSGKKAEKAGMTLGGKLKAGFKKSIAGLKKIMSKSIKAIGVIALAGGVAIGAALGKALKASIKQEEIFRKLQTAVESTGVQYDTAKSKIMSFLAEMQKFTRFGDTDLAPVLQQITLLTGSLEKGFKGTRLAANIASSGLFDLNTAARYVAMAMEGEVTMLGRYIPALKEAALKQAGITNQADKTAYAMKLLNEKFGSAAQKDLKTVGGRWQQLKNYIGDVQEKIGDLIAVKLKPKLDSWVTSIQNWIENGGLEEFANNLSVIFNSVANGTDKLAKGITKLVKAAAETKISKLNAAISAAEATLKNLENPGRVQEWFNKTFGNDTQQLIIDTKNRLAELRKEKGLLEATAVSTTPPGKDYTPTSQPETPKPKGSTAGGLGSPESIAAQELSMMIAENEMIGDELDKRYKNEKEAQNKLDELRNQWREKRDEKGKEDLETTDYEKWTESMKENILSFESVASDSMDSLMAGFDEMWKDWAVFGSEAIENTSNDFTRGLMTMVNAFASQIQTMIAKWLALKAVMAIANIIAPGSGEGIGKLFGAQNGGSFINKNNAISKMPAFATGGSMIVPPGYPSDGAFVRVGSGEQLDVTPAGAVGKDAKLLSGILNAIKAQTLTTLKVSDRVNSLEITTGELRGRDLQLAVEKSQMIETRMR